MTTSEAGPAVEVTDLTFTFARNDRPTLSDISLTLPFGARCLLLGSNGSGKSTLLSILAGKRMIKGGAKVLGCEVFFGDSAGCVWLGTEWASNPVVRSDIGVENFLSSIWGTRHAERRDFLLSLLDVDLQWRMHQISDGERRRVQLVYGLMSPFEIVLLDEVTVDLDVLVRSRLLDWLKHETETRGATVLYATHIFDGMDTWPTHISHLRLGRTTTRQPLAWPLTDDSPDVPDGVRAKMDDPNRRGSKLLELALAWLAEDRKIREDYERSGELRRRGPAQETKDAKAFFEAYDYSH